MTRESPVKSKYKFLGIEMLFSFAISNISSLIFSISFLLLYMSTSSTIIGLSGKISLFNLIELNLEKSFASNCPGIVGIEKYILSVFNLVFVFS